MPIVSLAKAKEHLNIDVADYDAELTGYLGAATEVVEHYVGAVEPRSLTERYSGVGTAELILRHPPVQAVTAVVENGTALAAADYSLSDAGVLVRMAGQRPHVWPYGRNNITVDYTAGRASVLDNFVLAGLIIIGHLWETQRGSGGSPLPGGSNDNMLFTPNFSFAIPRRAVELLQTSRIPGV
ncbi:head-tail connector protein [Nonomuraea dietziae]|uniref:head-tail connector protein n=1 Tax=Nonomuraea dietziae TaxID=65515 RepID=UPI003424D753